MSLLKNYVKSALSHVAFRRNHSGGYILYEYRKSDGTFDYERYRHIQTEGNRRKIKNVWAIEENMAFLSRYILEVRGKPHFGICHGTRRGKEQEWFRKHLDCEVIGTEISDTAKQFPHTIQWDFHETKPEWLDAVDFIYSNSFDHSYDPQRCLDAWMSCLKPGGLCILEHSSLHGPAGTSELDPFGADIAHMPYLVTLWGDGRYYVRQLLQAPVKSEAVSHLYFVVIQRVERLADRREQRADRQKAPDALPPTCPENEWPTPQTNY